MAVLCKMCGDLKVDADGSWRAFCHIEGQVWASLRDLRQSVHSCPSGGCHILLQAIEKCFPDKLDHVTHLTHWSSHPGDIGVFFDGEPTGRMIQLICTDGERHPIWSAVPRGFDLRDLTSHESLAFVRDNLDKCTRDHVACQPYSYLNEFMPKRILDIGNVDDGLLEPAQRAPIRLIESSSIVDNRTYVCLSHRWGSPGTTIVTERATLEKHCAGIPITSLGTVYMDTVHILRRMNVRYMWIDSLCIIQDDVEDWKIESKEMAKIYSGAWFTLARQCESSKATSITCLNTRSFKIDHELLAPDVFAYPEIPHIWNWIANLLKQNEFPLNTRGWVYQERLLSRRIVHYSDREISWECGETQACQCGWTLRATSKLDIPKVEHARALGLTNRLCEPDRVAIKRRWREMVSNFAPLDLTYETDRLPAFQGYVEQIKERIGDEYCFGLWENSLVEDLLWSVDNETVLQRRSPVLFQLPTWSWASVMGGINYDSVVERCATAAFTASEGGKNTGPAQYHVTITGRCVPAKLTLLTMSHGSERSETILGIGSDDGPKVSVLGSYIFGEIKPKQGWRGFRMREDFEMRTDGSVDTNQVYDVVIVRLAKVRSSNPRNACLVVWTYGKGVPGRGSRGEMRNGHPLYQRIGTTSTIAELEHNDPDHEYTIDWSLADENTIILE